MIAKEPETMKDITPFYPGPGREQSRIIRMASG